MGILKDAIIDLYKEMGVNAKWVDTEKPRRIKSAAQSKYDDLRMIEPNYTKGVHKARKEAAK